MKKVMAVTVLTMLFAITSVFAHRIQVGEPARFEWQVINDQSKAVISSGSGTVTPRRAPFMMNLETYTRENAMNTADWNRPKHWTRTVNGVRQRLIIRMLDGIPDDDD